MSERRNSFNVHILAADHVFYEGPSESLIVPAPLGQMGILANHSNMVTAIVPGRMDYRLPGEHMQYAAVAEGLVKVENGEVLVLVDSIERPEEIDVNRAKRKAEEAEEAILQKKSRLEYRTAQADLARALNRLKVKNRRR